MRKFEKLDLCPMEDEAVAMRSGTRGSERSTTTTTSTAASSVKQSSSSSTASNLMIDDLPDGVLVEILCRIEGNNNSKYIFQCKCVSKRWSCLISTPYFIKRFVCIQSDKKTPVVRTMVGAYGEEFLCRVSPSSSSWSKPLTPLFKRIVSTHCLKLEPIVVGSYNDLILCCASRTSQRDYYICNPLTRQWVALPPPPQCREILSAVGFICDHPYYYDKAASGPSGNSNMHIDINANYRCRVVRLIPPTKRQVGSELISPPEAHAFKFSVEIFSSETGEWKESIVSSPADFLFPVDLKVSHAYKGMLFWKCYGVLPGHQNIFIGLDPFTINSDNTTTSTSSSTCTIDEPYQCLFLDLDKYAVGITDPVIFCYGENQGCLRMCEYERYDRCLCVWDFKEQDMKVADGAQRYYLKSIRVVEMDEELDPEEFQLYCNCNMLCFDPDNEDIFYVNVGDDIFKCNSQTGRSIKMLEGKGMKCLHFYPLVLQWWPTPVPTLARHEPMG